MTHHTTTHIPHYTPTPNGEPQAHTSREGPTELHIRPTIITVTFNTMGMHNTILDLHHILSTPTKPTILHLTETKHSHIKSIWKEALKKLYTHPHITEIRPRHKSKINMHYPSHTKRHLQPTTKISAPIHLRDFITAATLTPHKGFPIIATSAHMPKIHTKEQEAL